MSKRQWGVLSTDGRVYRVGNWRQGVWHPGSWLLAQRNRRRLGERGSRVVRVGASR